MTHKRLSQRIADEQGWVLISATILTLIMLSIALVAAGMIDNGTKRTREQRERESALNVDEGVLYAQSLVLHDGVAERRGDRPGHGQPAVLPRNLHVVRRGRPPLPERGQPRRGELCQPWHDRLPERRPAQERHLEDEGARQRRRAGARVRPRRRRTSRRPAAPSRPACTPTTACTYDANKDRELWVQSQAIVRGKPRNVVARLRLEQLAESVPRSAVTSGAVKITNNGNHGGTPIIDATGSQVIVRCANPANNSCADFQPGQIKPGAPQSDADGPEPDVRRAAPALQAARDHRRPLLRGLPGRPRGTSPGTVVWVEGCTSPPNLTSKVPTTACGASLPAGLDPDCVNSQDLARTADLALRHGRHGRRLDLPRAALRRQQLRRHLRRVDAGTRRRDLQQLTPRTDHPATRSPRTAASASGASSRSTGRHA